MYSYISPEVRVRADHPLRAIRAMADAALQNMSERFDAMYARTGRPSIPPEKLLRAQLIQMLYSVRSERWLVEERDYSMLLRWLVGMNLDEPVWDVTVFTKNRNRLLEGDVACEFLSEVVQQAPSKGLTSDEHLTVDGTLIEAWASLKSFQAKDRKKTPPDNPGKSEGELPWRETKQPDPRVHDRCRRAVGAEGQRQRGQAELQWESADGEPQRADREHGSVPGQGHRRGRRGTGDAGAGSWPHRITGGRR